MFKKLYSLGDFGPSAPDPSDGWYEYRYIIEDTHFTEQWIGMTNQRLNYAAVRCGAIIQCYESKHDNVAFQLALYHKFMMATYYWYKLEDEIQYNIEHTPMYGEYAPVVRDYLQRVDKLKAFW